MLHIERLSLNFAMPNIGRVWFDDRFPLVFECVVEQLCHLAVHRDQVTR